MPTDPRAEFAAMLHRRITAVLSDLDQVEQGRDRTHHPMCWTDPSHGDCLREHVRRILTGSGTTPAAGETRRQEP